MTWRSEEMLKRAIDLADALPAILADAVAQWRIANTLRYAEVIKGTVREMELGLVLGKAAHDLELDIIPNIPNGGDLR